MLDEETKQFVGVESVVESVVDGSERDRARLMEDRDPPDSLTLFTRLVEIFDTVPDSQGIGRSFLVF